ncbi:nucleotidyltransferase domain-containing protein [Staphylococcus equorum]|uniref:Nucleotidyltransferase domain-containing protein n=2 Tax=Staphylococcus equorum TaxID=246432 RepID=A0A9X4LAR9_9STAP|nr:nucleotidyltransferase domain-containing protein [Staphylococcus equorum]MDG0841284.1 nucleotidyltransferase domain-containing protein [Staphylococcus equorum]MDG0846984.1 nucleotidyltransferase domain-containing protein [Staphylococcus equorum]
MTLEGEELKKIQKFLSEIKDYVIVVGSVAEGTDNNESDIDFYVKTKSECEIDKEIESNNFSADNIEETYIDKIIKTLERYNIQWESLFVSYITTNSLSIQLEFAPIFDIRGKEQSTVKIYGIELESLVSK